MLDVAPFIERATTLYGYPHFLCDTSGSLCEVVDPEDPKDPVLTLLSKHVLLVYLEGSEAHAEELCRRFDRDPKPMYYPEAFLCESWAAYLAETGETPDEVDPDAFIRYGFRRLLEHRVPKYAAIARNWGVTVPATLLSGATTSEAFNTAIATAIGAKG